MLGPRDDLLDANGRDMEFRNVGTEVGIALVGADHEAAGLRNGKVRTGHAGLGTQKIWSRRPPLRLREVMDVIVARLRPDRSRKDVGDVATQFMDRRHDDVAGRLIVELLDALA